VVSLRGGTLFIPNAADILVNFFLVSREGEGIVHVVVGIWLSGRQDYARHRELGCCLY